MKLCATYFFLFLSLLISQLTLGQNNSVNVYWKEKQVVINGHQLDRNSTIENIHQFIGIESRLMTDPAEPTMLLIYDSLGINFIIDTATAKIRKIDVYCSKGRREFETSPKKLFAGEVTINDHLIKTDLKLEQIKTSTGIAFEELFPGYYWYLAENEEFNICIAYTNSERDTIGMIYILMEKNQE